MRVYVCTCRRFARTLRRFLSPSFALTPARSFRASKLKRASRGSKLIAFTAASCHPGKGSFVRINERCVSPRSRSRAKIFRNRLNKGASPFPRGRVCVARFASDFRLRGNRPPPSASSPRDAHGRSRAVRCFDKKSQTNARGPSSLVRTRLFNRGRESTNYERRRWIRKRRDSLVNNRSRAKSRVVRLYLARNARHALRFSDGRPRAKNSRPPPPPLLRKV